MVRISINKIIIMMLVISQLLLLMPITTVEATTTGSETTMVLRPNAIGYTSGDSLTSTDTPYYNAIDDVVLNTADYIQRVATGSGNNFSNISSPTSTTGTITKVIVTVVASDTGGAWCMLTPLIHLDAVSSSGSAYSVTSTITWFNTTIFTNNITGSPVTWSWANLTNMEAGFYYQGSDVILKVYQVYLTVYYGLGPTLSSLSPSCGDTSIDLLPTTRIQVNSSVNTTLNWYWKNGTAWQLYGTNITFNEGNITTQMMPQGYQNWTNGSTALGNGTIGTITYTMAPQACNIEIINDLVNSGVIVTNTTIDLRNISRVYFAWKHVVGAGASATSKFGLCTAADKYTDGFTYSLNETGPTFVNRTDYFDIVNVTNGWNFAGDYYLKWLVNSTGGQDTVGGLYIVELDNYSLFNGIFYQPFLNATSCCTTYDWAVNATDITGNWTNTSCSFTTLCPSAPTSFIFTQVNNFAFNVSWINYTKPTGCTGNVTCLVKYDTLGYPTMGTGYTLYNGSTYNYSLLSNASTNLIYYMSGWTYYEKMGYYCASSRTTTSGFPGGGTYNITIRWECNQSYAMATALLLNSTITLAKRDGTIISYKDDITNYTFNVSVNSTPDVIFLTFDNTTRALTPWTGNDYNLTFYVCCESECLYCGSNNYSNFQFIYTFSFVDQTPLQEFLISEWTKFYIYTFSNTGTKLYLDKDFLSASDTRIASLEYGKQYYCGIQNNETNRTLIGPFTPLSSLTIQIVIPPANTTVYNINSFITINTSNDTTGIWINYTDSSFGTNSVTIKFYNNSYTSNPFVNSYNFTTSTENYHWLVGVGASLTSTYNVIIEIDNSYFESNQTIKLSVFGWFISPKYNVDWINAAIESVLGICPLTPVSWTQTITFTIFIVCLLSFGPMFQELGVIFASVILIFMQAVVLDDAVIRGLAIATAIFMIIFSMIIYIRRQKNESF